MYLGAVRIVLKVAAANGCVRGVEHLVATHVLSRAHCDGHTVATATAEGVQVVLCANASKLKAACTQQSTHRAITLKLQRNGVGKAVGGLEQLHGYLHAN